MKKNILLMVCFLGLFACDNEKSVLPFDSDTEVSEIIEFKGLQIRVDGNFSKENLFQSDEEFAQDLQKELNSNLRGGNESLEISNEEFKAFIWSEYQNLPRLNVSEKSIEHFDILKKDFLDIDNMDKVFENSGTIVDFYSIKLRNTLKLKIKELNFGKKNRSITSEDDSANAMEISYGLSHPASAYAMLLASGDANNMTDSKFFPDAHLIQDVKINAYRHASWNMIGVHHMLNGGMFKNDAIGKARDFATLHEMIYVGNTNGIKPSAIPTWIYGLHVNWGLNTANANAMDLSNNSVGRSLIDDMTGWLKSSSLTKIKTAIDAKVVGTSSSNYRYSLTIISTYHGNNWDALASNRFGGTSTPLYIINVDYITL